MNINKLTILAISFFIIIETVGIPVSAKEITGDLKHDLIFSSHPDLSEYISIALLRNPKLLSAYNNWMAKAEKSNQTGTMPEPILSYMFPVKSMQTDPIYEKQRIIISQMFPWFGKLSWQERIAISEADTEHYIYEDSKREIIYKVTNAYFEYFYAGKAVENTQRTIQLLSYLEEVTRTRYEAGQADFEDLLKLQLEIEKMRNELISYQEQLPVYSDRLSAEIGIAGNGALPLPVDFKTNEINKDFKADASDKIKENPSIKMLDSMIEAAEAMKSRAGKEYFPDIMVSLEYHDMESRVVPAMNDLSDSVMLMFSINLPIKFNKYSSMVSESEQSLISLQMKRNDELNRLSVSFKQAKYMLDESDRRIELYSKSLIPKARESVNVAMENFMNGKKELISFIDAERMLLEMELQLDRAKADREIAAAEIEMIIGNESPITNTDNANVKK